MRNEAAPNGVRRLFCAVAVMCALTSCTSFDEANRMTTATTAKIEKSKMPGSSSVVRKLNAPYLMGPAVKPEKRVVPAVLTQEITIVSAVPMTLREVAGQITLITSIPCNVQDSDAGKQATTTASRPPAGDRSDLGRMLSDLADVSGGAGNAGIVLHYKGPLSGLLDVLRARSGYYWKYRNGNLDFFRTETKTFLVPAFAGNTQSTNSIMSSNGSSGTSTAGVGAAAPAGASGGSGGGGGACSITATSTIDTWKNMEKVVKTVAGGAKVFVDPSLGSVTVTGTPPQVDAVGEWVAQLDRELSGQIALKVHVYDVALTNEQNYGINPTIAFNELAGRYGVAVQGVNAPAVLSTQASPLTVGASILSGQWKGTGVVLQALATMGKVVSSYSRSACTMNGQPAAIQVATNTGYLASTSTMLAANVGSSASLTPGMVTTGFTAMITPRIIGAKIYLGINMTISSLLSMQTITSAGQSIQTPQTASFAEQQSASLKSGEILVLTGYQEKNASVTKNGVGSPNFPLLGGGADATTGNRMIVITVTATTI